MSQTVYSDIGALPAGADALFLAAHTPMKLDHLLGQEVAGEGNGEADVLNALLGSVGDKKRNTLIAVTGGSGAGKSHVVRWVHANLDLDEERFHVLYVPRAIQTIRDLLRCIVDGLPVDGDQLMERVDAAVGRVSKDELKDRILQEICHVITWTVALAPPREGESHADKRRREDRNNLLGSPDDSGKRRGGLADLLNVGPVNSAMLAPGRTIDRVVESILETTSRRDEQHMGFSELDLPLKQAGVLRALRQDEELNELWMTVTEDVGTVVDVLNEALGMAMITVLGLRAQHGETLDALFRHARMTLKQQGKELIMLFEDLAQFGLIDGELYDQFATQPGDDMTPLRVVFAVTNQPFGQIRDTVRTRIAHRFAVTDSSLDDHREFLGRYLNLVRLGGDRVQQAWQDARKAKITSWVDNACDSRGPGGTPCEFREQCHAGFGKVEITGLGEVGLYPYNDIALRRAVDRPTDEPRSPRADLDFCVTTVLTEAHTHIGKHTFPHDRLFDKFEHTATGARESLMADESGSESDRLYRARVLWGDEAPLNATISEAFALPVVASSDSSSSAAAATTTTAPSTPRVPEQQGPRPPARETSVHRVRSPLHPLFQWQNGDPMPDKELKTYRDILYTFVQSRLNLDEHLIHTRNDATSMVLLAGYFKRASFDFGSDAQGRSVGQGNIRFDLERNSADVKVLMAARWYYDHLHWEPANGQWSWPEGSDPVDMALTLECRIDEWAAAVVDGFLSRFGPLQIAKAAVAVRSIARLCTGTPAGAVKSLADALAPIDEMPTADSWKAVLPPAIDLLTKPLVTNLLTEFAAVHQGTGEAQLIDTATVTADIPVALTSPTTYLEDVAKRYSADVPTLASAARKLLDAVVGAGPALLAEARSAKDELTDGLAGDKPSVVAEAAAAFGRRAREANLFRPADGYPAFEDALQVLTELPPRVLRSDERTPSDPEADAAVFAQPWASGAVAGATALATIRTTVTATREECKRNIPEFKELDHVEDQVRQKATAIKGALMSLDGVGDLDA